MIWKKVVATLWVLFIISFVLYFMFWTELDQQFGAGVRSIAGYLIAALGIAAFYTSTIGQYD